LNRAPRHAGARQIASVGHLTTKRYALRTRARVSHIPDSASLQRSDARAWLPRVAWEIERRVNTAYWGARTRAVCTKPEAALARTAAARHWRGARKAPRRFENRPSKNGARCGATKSADRHGRPPDRRTRTSDGSLRRNWVVTTSPVTRLGPNMRRRYGAGDDADDGDADYRFSATKPLWSAVCEMLECRLMCSHLSILPDGFVTAKRCLTSASRTFRISTNHCACN